MRQHKLKKIVVAAALAIAGWSHIAPVGAAGLGKLTVSSSLGQPLRAEIDLTAVTREEANSLSARLGTPEAFRQAGIDYNSALLGVRFAVSRRPSGQYFISLASNQPINEPFIDLLVELNWASGRLVREYTFLLDPADMKPAVPPVAVTEPKPVAQAEVPRAAPAAPMAQPMPAPVAPAPAVAEKPAPKPVPAAKPAPAPKAEAAAKPAGSYEVKKGDTLGKIARQNKADGVTLEQMLVAIQRSNPDAFAGGNINRLRSGVILNLPDKDAASGVAGDDARRIVAAQTADWKSYQDKLAGSVAAAPATKAEAPKQEARGKITAKVEDKAQKGDAKDQLKLSKADPAATMGGAKPGPKAAEEDKIARERAIKEAKAREAELEKNVKDLQKLAEVKNQQMADLQKQAQAKAADAKKAPEPPKAEPSKAADAKKSQEPVKVDPPKAEAPKVAAVPVAPPAKAEPPKAVEPAKAPEAPKAPEPPKAAEPAKAPEAAKAADAGKPADPPKAPADAPKAVDAPKTDVAAKAAEPPKGPDTPKADDAPKPAPKRAAVPPPPPPPEPSVMDEFLDNPLYLAGGGGILALLGGYAAYAVRRKRKVEKFENSIITGGDLKANSVFGNTGGQNVDTGNSSFQSDFSQVSTGAIDADEVDPVAEADVYMAYGRDAQAEEILKEALQKDPSRHAVRVKLMEIYSQRSDTASFEGHARELHTATGGVGEHWAKAAELGRVLMPGNALFGAGGESAAADAVTSTVTLGAGALAAAAAAAEPPAANMESTMQMAAFPGGVAPTADTMSKTLSLAPVQAEAPSIDVDFDLGGAAPEASPGAAPDFDLDAGPATTADSGDIGLDFDIGGGDLAPVAPAAPAPAVPMMPDTDFSPGGTLIMSADAAADLTMDETQPLPDVRPPESPSIDFDFDLSADAPAAPSASAAAPADAGNGMDFDLSGIDLDLPGGDGASPASAEAPADDAATKLDLAKAYQDMGDKEGAKELLQEVLKEGSEGQKAEARNLLATLG